MKGVLLVVFDPKTKGLDFALSDSLAAHRLDEDAESWPHFYWDYWHFMSPPFGGCTLDRTDIDPGAKCNSHSCLVDELPDDYNPSAIITLMGSGMTCANLAGD